jgi:hypothetical protein
MPALLAMIPTKDMIYAALIAVLIACGFWYHHKVLAEGIAEQQAADNKASAALAATTAAQTAELKAKATMAEQAYDKEIAALSNRPGTQPVRLCLDPHNSGGVVPKAGGKVAGNVGASSGAVGVQPVSSGNSVGGEGAAGPDISGMLSALAAGADQVSATLREYQGR